MGKISEYVLESLPNDLFTDRDILSLHNGGKNSRYALIKRAIKSGEIIRLKRGIYCLGKQYRRKDLNTFAIAQILYGPSYVSMESALSFHQWIPEGVFMTTCVSMLRKSECKTPVGDFSYTCVPQKCFYLDVDHVVSKESDYYMASPLKALCDYVYVHKEKWKGIKPLVMSLRVEEEALARLTGEECGRLYDNYRSRRVRGFIEGLKKDLKV